MDASDFLNHLPVVQGATGAGVTLEERTVLQQSLLVLQKNGRFDRVVFWGKIAGIKKDYLIAQGFSRIDTEFKKRSFCSHDGITWVQLPEVDELSALLLPKVAGRFMGEPSHEYRVYNPPPEDEANVAAASEEEPEEDEYEEEEEDEEEEEGHNEDGPGDLEDAPPKRARRLKKHFVNLSEEKRLAAAVAEIDLATSVAPRGAFLLTPDHEVKANNMFAGLTGAAAAKLTNYYHLREPERIKNKSLLDFELEGLSKGTDFLDAVQDDVPAGSWSVQFDPSTKVALLRCNQYPGFVAYHVAGTPKHGYVYFGHGDRNSDLAFMV